MNRRDFSVALGASAASLISGSGVAAAPISVNVASTCAVCRAASGELASTTCSRSSASTTSSSVARNAFTRVVGKFRMKPTVSLISTRRLEGNVSGRTVGSSVAPT